MSESIFSYLLRYGLVKNYSSRGPKRYLSIGITLTHNDSLSL